MHHYNQVIAAPELVWAPKKSKEDCHTEKHVIHLDHLEQIFWIGANLSEEAKVSLVVLLKHYSKVFVWQPTDMTRVDCEVIEHNLSIIPGSTPIK